MSENYLPNYEMAIRRHLLTIEALAMVVNDVLVAYPFSQKLIAEFVGRYIVKVKGCQLATFENVTQFLLNCGFDKDTVLDLSVSIPNQIQINQLVQISEEK